MTRFEIAPTSLTAMTYDAAILYCAACTHNGHSDWRLPSYPEYFTASDTPINQYGTDRSWYTEDSKRHDPLLTNAALLTATPVRTAYSLEYAPSTGLLTYDEAVMYCFLCTHNGHKDWRMPTEQEWLHSDSIIGWFRERHQSASLRIVSPVRTIYDT